MDILVDFDNLEEKRKGEDILTLCTRIVQALANKVAMPSHCRVRLYGGWFLEARLTHLALDISSDIANFPKVVRWSAKSRTGSCIVSAELATTIEADRTRPLTHTFRVRRFDDKVQVQSALLAKCDKTPCGVVPVETFFKDKRCANARCYMTPGDLLEKKEQKLVDTMLTVDLVYLSTLGRRELAVVSSDDDLWPGIHMALLSGAQVTHLHTKDRRTHNAYCSGFADYRETTL